MGTEIQVGSNAIEELYGPNAITANLDDIQVQTGAGGTHVTIKSDNEGAIEDGSLDQATKPNSDSSDDNPDSSTPKNGEETPDGDGEKGPGVERNELKETINNLGQDLKGKGVDFESALKELETAGVLSEETYTKLADAGYPKAVIDGYIKAAEIVEREFEKAVHSLAGTQKEYETVLAWANQNATKAEQTAYDSALERGDLQTAKLYMDSFMSRMGKQFGTTTPRVSGAPTPTTTVDGFETKKDLTKATSDSRYGRDAKYTKEIQARILKTTWL